MPTFSSMQIPPPKNWQDFESLCCDLWKEIWEDPYTQKNGRQGQPQHGVDINGRPKQGTSWAGIQCKGKDNFADKTLTAEEIRGEVEKAKSFKPSLSEYIIATTGPKDAKVEELARLITEEHIKKGLFSVTVLGWDDIVNFLEVHLEVIEKHYPQFGFTRGVLKKEDLGELTSLTQQLIRNKEEGVISETKNSITVDQINIYTSESEFDNAIKLEHQAEIDHSRDLLKHNKPKEALEYLEKLKERIWFNSDPIIKFRLLTNIGSAKLAMNSPEEAAKLFLDALQHNPDDEKAICNASLGHFILGNPEHANELARNAIENNPSSVAAYTTLIQAMSSEYDFEDILREIPEYLRKEEKITLALGHVAENKGNFIDASKWFKLAVENGKDLLSESKAALGIVMLRLISEQEKVRGSISTEESQKLKESIAYLTEAWDTISSTELRVYRVAWIMNRSIAKSLLLDIKEAIKDIDVALEIDPANPIFIKHRGILAFQDNDYANAVTHFEKLLNSDKVPESPLLLSEALIKNDKPEDAMQILQKYLEGDIDEQRESEARRILANLYADLQNTVDAKKEADLLLSSNRTDILNITTAARVSRLANNRDDALILIKEAERYLTNNSTYREYLAIADEFYCLEQYEDATKYFEKIIDPSTYIPLTDKLLDSYYQSGEHGKALNLCQSIRHKYGPLEHVTEMESVIYEEIGNLPQAKELCENYLKEYPTDFNMKLRLAIINLKSDNFDELDQFLKGPIDIDSLELEQGLYLSELYEVRNLYQYAFEFMYELRRKFYNRPEAHLYYVRFFLRRDKELDHLLNIKEVCYDSVVFIEDQSGNKEYFIIEERDEPDSSRREINDKSLISNELIGKSVNDEFVLRQNKFTRETGRIIEIKSKYVHAFHESPKIIERFFPDTEGITSISFKPPNDEEEKEKELQPILNLVSERSNLVSTIEKLYKNRKISIGGFSEIIGINVLDVWGGLIRKPDLGIRCSTGLPKEILFAHRSLENQPNLIIDVISLMTIHELDIADTIVEHFGKLGIAQSTIDLLKSSISEKSWIRSRGSLSLIKERDQIYKDEIPPDVIEKNIEYLETLLEWVDNNCEVIPCNAALNIKTNQKDQLDTTFGRSFIDSVLIAKEPNTILFSDDLILRLFAKNEFGVEGVWTQSVLMQLLEKGLIERIDYNKLIIRLVSSHYHHTSIDSDILLEAAKMSKWSNSDPFNVVAKALSAYNTDEISAINVAAEFLYKLWREPIMPHQRDYIIFGLLDGISIGRNNNQLVTTLSTHISTTFRLLPIAEQELLSKISVWHSMQLD